MLTNVINMWPLHFESNDDGTLVGQGYPKLKGALAGVHAWCDFRLEATMSLASDGSLRLQVYEPGCSGRDLKMGVLYVLKSTQTFGDTHAIHIMNRSYHLPLLPSLQCSH
jgi:hypothetical protein